MSKPTIAMTATPMVVKQSGENISKKFLVASKFFKQGTDIRPCMPSSVSKKKNKRDNTIPKSHVERMVCSEDVSRKKVKLDVTTKFSMKNSSAQDNIENDGDILECLITNFHKDYSKQSESQSESQHRKKMSAKPRTLFNEESIKLINDFKEYLREKDQADRETVNTDFLKPHNSTIPLNDTSNSQYDRGTNYHTNDLIRNNGSNNHSHQISLPQRDLIDIKTINEKTQSYYPPQLINMQGTSSQSFSIRRTIADVRSMSQMQLSDPLSFVTTVMDSADDNDPISRYPTPPLTYSPPYTDN